ncbi:MAG: HlyD family efflux transporter periplasmic adaptor subunit [Sulfurospirillaceae bacterium]|jgi:multidrug resistance efflux pump|nr:HlyD family efflux transporter periplasmic adaptor subunit [Sulfurospirillaceae bacterium]MDD2825953.1 HlyD family efflux transporter periplasmic adaptor subunit [Sulfurospirillaceae bacterium]
MKKILIVLLIMIQGLMAEEVYATFDVVSERSSELGLSISGIVGALHVEVGDKVKKGDLLLTLHNEQEKKELEIAQKNAEHSQKTYARYAAIADVIDKEKMENYTYDRDITRLNAQNKEIVYKKTELRAPYNLVVTKKLTELGNIVLGSQTKLLSVVSTNDVKLVLKFDEKYWQKIKVGQKFTYTVDGSTTKYVGTISKVYPTIIPSTREMQAEVKTTALMPGLFGNGTISVE